MASWRSFLVDMFYVGLFEELGGTTIDLYAEVWYGGCLILSAEKAECYARVEFREGVMGQALN